MKKRRTLGGLIIGVTIMMTCPKVVAQTPWPTPVYQTYLEQCRSSLISQGADSRKSEIFCYCLATGLSGEFGMEEYEHIRRIQPNAKGNKRERRLYQVFEKCGQAIK